MTVKAIYENGVLRPKDPLPLNEREEVEIEIRRSPEPAGSEEDPRSFVGFIKSGIPGMPVAAHHDKFLEQDQYAHLKAYLRTLMASPEWDRLSQGEKLERFKRSCRNARPDFENVWEDMDRIPHVWSNALEYCTRAIEREAAARRG